jgi:hypothetical protein
MWEFFAQHLGWIAAIIASLGGLGVAFAIIAFGLPAAIVLSKLVDALSGAIGFFKTPAGQGAAMMLIFLAAFVAGDVHRTRIDQAQWHAQQAAAAAAAARHDAELQSFATADADARIADVEARAKDLQQKVIDYEKTIAARKMSACLATSDDARGLQRIEHAPVAGQHSR